MFDFVSFGSRRLITLVCLLPFFQFTFSQSSEKVWELLLNNKRAEALNLVTKNGFQKDIETFFLKQIVRMENGKMMPEEGFVEDLVTYDNYENYLFAHWMMPYIFADYLESGYGSFNLGAYDIIDADKVANSTVQAGLNYYKSIINRYKLNWEAFDAHNAKINAIRDWEFCGVFENLNNSGLATPYEPEFKTTSDERFDAQRMGKVRWYPAFVGRVEPYRYFSNHSEFGTGISYAQTFIQSAEVQRVQLRVGKAGVIRIWLNDVLIMENTSDVTTELDAFTYNVNLQKGNNRLLIKVGSEAVTPYFIARITDMEGQTPGGITISLKDQNYRASTPEIINAEKEPHSVIAFFENKLEHEAGNTFFTRFSLYLALMRNSEYDAARAIIYPWLEQYPKSSLLKSCLRETYATAGDDVAMEEIMKNIEQTDPDYYLSFLNKIQDIDELFKLDKETYESTLNTLAEITDYPFIKIISEVMIQLRGGNLDSLELAVDKLMSEPSTPSSFTPLFANIYSEALSKDEKTIGALESIVSQSLNVEAIKYLSYFYQKQNRTDRALDVFEPLFSHLDYDNDFIYVYIQKLHKFQRYEESLPFIEMGLQNYPDSYTFLKLKGDVYQQLGNTKEAVAIYEKAIEKKSSNKTLRKLIYDLKNEKDPLERFRITDTYGFVDENRGVFTSNNYGINIILDQTDVLKYKNGGGRYKSTYVYEVTSQKGIESLKEYNLGLSGDYAIFKSEIIKPDGSLVPAEANGSQFVFNGLSVGDVVHLDFESSFTSRGRFYKDYVDIESFDSYHPTILKTYRLFTEIEAVNHQITNGDIVYKKQRANDLYVHEWSLSDNSGMPKYEDYMPSFSDVARSLHISSIGSWSEIANWYSDLVRSQIEFDDTVKDVFTTLFPEGHGELSEEERARRIYDYITGNLTYSHVSFKQSGFVPQKPSKTIRTKLGDCKDFSALFVTLAREAGLTAQMVLILTSDNGEKALLMPSTDFNHCVVKVDIDDKDQYLELTDKYLPYKSLPISLIDAAALEIPFISNGNSNEDLFILKDPVRKLSYFNTNSVVEIGEERSSVVVTTKTSGHLSSYYDGMLTEENDDVLKEDVYQELYDRCGKDITVIKIEDHNDTDSEDIRSYTTYIRLNEKVNKIGSLYTFQIPYFLNPYTEAIVNLENRKHPIDYKKYENADGYRDITILRLEEGRKFVEIPENLEIDFENHRFSITYEKTKENELKVSLSADMDLSPISPENYTDFRNYVKQVLEAKKQFIAYR